MEVLDRLNSGRFLRFFIFCGGTMLRSRWRRIWREGAWNVRACIAVAYGAAGRRRRIVATELVAGTAGPFAGRLGCRLRYSGRRLLLLPVA